MHSEVKQRRSYVALLFASGDLRRYVRAKESANMDKIENLEVEEVFNNYPESIRQKLIFLRHLVLETASETEGVNKLEETLRWGEPSFLTKNGSTIRMDWKKSKPDEYALYFNCKTKLIDTFKEPLSVRIVAFSPGENSYNERGRERGQQWDIPWHVEKAY